jgi:uncharacterized protein YacL
MKLRIVGLSFSSIFAIGFGLLGFSLTTVYLALSMWRDKTFSGTWVNKNFQSFEIFSYILFTSLGVLLGFLIGSIIYRKLLDISKNLKYIPIEDKIAVSIGTLLSLIPVVIIGFLISSFGTGLTPTVKFAFILIESAVVIWLCNLLALSMKEEVKFLIPGNSRKDDSRPQSTTAISVPTGMVAKILDTNIIIDGRILEVCKSGFLEGPLLIPGFVLEELQHIADSADGLKRARGRRGLDILHQMQKELEIEIKVFDRYKINFAPSDAVDIKLVKLAKVMNCHVMTNDFNLNKVAKIHNVKILNVNELANAVKPIVLPGEEMRVTLVKEGNQQSQAVAYLDDGTMVVVENGRKMLQETVTVTVSSVLQTVAGKMIFAELKNETKQDNSNNTSGGVRKKN